MKKIIIFLLLSCNFVLADVYNNPVKFENIIEKMPELKSIKCTFKQEKHLQNIKKPLISSGDFEFIKNKGVYFYTKYPIQTKNNYTNENYKQINDIINAISNKKYSRIEKEFSFYYEGNINNWTLGLKPKEKSKAYNYISSITIKGANYVQKISINQTNGNKTLIWFVK